MCPRSNDKYKNCKIKRICCFLQHCKTFHPINRPNRWEILKNEMGEFVTMQNDKFVYLLTCLSVRISQKLHGQTSLNFCARCLWPRLGPSLTALRYFMYFRFCGWLFHTMGSMRLVYSVTAENTASIPTKILLLTITVAICAPAAKSPIYDCLV